MAAYNHELEKYRKMREKIRKEVCSIMRNKKYYESTESYRRVAALTGLETYLTYMIETLETKIALVKTDDTYID